VLKLLLNISLSYAYRVVQWPIQDLQTGGQGRAP